MSPAYPSSPSLNGGSNLARSQVPFSQLFKTPQETIAEKEGEITVFVGRMPIGFTGFMTSIASSQITGVKWSFIIDGEIVEENMDSLGQIDSPRAFDPPYLIRSYVEIRAKNSTRLEPMLSAFAGGNAYTSQEIGQIEPIRPLEPLSTVLSDIREDLEKKTPKGEVTDELITVTDQVYLLDGLAAGDGEADLNWTSFSIQNQGPGNLYFTVNKWKQPQAPIEVGGVRNVDFSSRGSIKKIYMVSDSGSTTVASIHALK